MSDMVAVPGFAQFKNVQPSIVKYPLHVWIALDRLRQLCYTGVFDVNVLEADGILMPYICKLVEFLKPLNFIDDEISKDLAHDFDYCDGYQRIIGAHDPALGAELTPIMYESEQQPGWRQPILAMEKAFRKKVSQKLEIANLQHLAGLFCQVSPHSTTSAVENRKTGQRELKHRWGDKGNVSAQRKKEGFRRAACASALMETPCDRRP